MKTRNLILPFLATLAIGCTNCTGPTTHTKPAVVAEAPKPPPPPQPTVITQDAFTVTLPAGWKVDTTVKTQAGKDLNEILSADSPTNVGRGPVHVELMSTPFDGPEQLFAMIASKVMEESIANSEVVKRGLGKLGDHVGSLTILQTDQGVGIVALAVASGNTGYILTCGGDDSTAELGTETAKLCHEVTDSFKVK